MIILTGVAGAGKSMQGRYLADEAGYPWLSTGCRRPAARARPGCRSHGRCCSTRFPSNPCDAQVHRAAWASS